MADARCEDRSVISGEVTGQGPPTAEGLGQVDLARTVVATGAVVGLGLHDVAGEVLPTLQQSGAARRRSVASPRPPTSAPCGRTRRPAVPCGPGPAARPSPSTGHRPPPPTPSRACGPGSAPPGPVHRRRSTLFALLGQPGSGRHRTLGRAQQPRVAFTPTAAARNASSAWTRSSSTSVSISSLSDAARGSSSTASIARDPAAHRHALTLPAGLSQYNLFDGILCAIRCTHWHPTGRPNDHGSSDAYRHHKERWPRSDQESHGSAGVRTVQM